jgi:uncharacterized protein (TIGR03067 family)
MRAHSRVLGERGYTNRRKETRMIARIVVLLATGLLLAAEPPAKEDAEKKDLDQLQGDWTMVAMEFRGDKAGEEQVKNNKLTIKGDKWTVTIADRETKATFKIDPSKDPKTLDLTITINDVITRSKGIYKLDGDTFTLCRTTGDVERPKEFKTANTGAGLVVWKRVSK